MKSKISFSIKTLLFGIENPKGAIEQVLFAKMMAEHLGMPCCNCLAKLTFADTNINKALSGAVPLDETLIIGYEGWNDNTLHLCIRSGRTACKIATGSSTNREIEIFDDYRNAIILRKLSEKEIMEIFNYVWDNMEIIQPDPNPIRED